MLRSYASVLPMFVCCLLAGNRAQAAQAPGLSLQFTAQPKPVSVTVSGMVKDKKTGYPIAGALVRGHLALGRLRGPDIFENCPSQETRTDASGNYSLKFVTPLSTSGPLAGKDFLCVYAGANGYETRPQYGTAPVTAQRATFSNFDFALEAGKPVRAVVLGPDGKPVGGALVRVQNAMNGDWNAFGSMGRTLTGEDGSFELWVAPGSDYLGKPWISVVKPGVGTLILWDFPAKDDLGQVMLNPGAEVSGRIVGPDGAAVSACEVSARAFPFGVVSAAVTGLDGAYVLKGIPGETSRKEFYIKKNGRYEPAWGKTEVFARVGSGMPLKDAARFEIAVQDGRTVTAPETIVGAHAEVAGTVLPSKTALGLGGLLVRLDGKWENMVETDVNGRFRFPYVAPGKHKLTAYLPHNLRYDRGIGSVEIEVSNAEPVPDAAIQLIDLAELRVQYLDANGNPLAGITAAATWSKSGEGGWTEGTVSDAEGWAVLYLYPESVQYVRGQDAEHKLTAETVKGVKPGPGEVLSPMQVVMVPAAALTGRVVRENGGEVANQNATATIEMADGMEIVRGLRTDESGRFRIENLTPGVLRMSVEFAGTVYKGLLKEPVQLRPGASESVGDLVLKDGVNKAEMVQQKHAEAVAHPEELTRFAREFFTKIQTADYDYFLQEGSDWQKFPIFGSYQTYKWWDVFVPWMCQTFKTNPIVSIELGKAYANSKQLNGVKGLPVVPYKLTLRDGSALEGNLPFQYEFEGTRGHWFGVEGIDWHLQGGNSKENEGQK